jgi:hypothetical protein
MQLGRPTRWLPWYGAGRGMPVAIPEHNDQQEQEHDHSKDYQDQHCRPGVRVAYEHPCTMQEALYRVRPSQRGGTCGARSSRRSESDGVSRNTEQSGLVLQTRNVFAAIGGNQFTGCTGVRSHFINVITSPIVAANIAAMASQPAPVYCCCFVGMIRRSPKGKPPI